MTIVRACVRYVCYVREIAFFVDKRGAWRVPALVARSLSGSRVQTKDKPLRVRAPKSGTILHTPRTAMSNLREPMMAAAFFLGTHRNCSALVKTP